MTTLMDNPKVFLQTLKVMLKSDTREVSVLALIDTGSQKSYILKNTAARMGYGALREEEVVHCLFGGVTTEHSKHRCFKIRLGNLDGSFSCNFESLDQSVICGKIQPIGSGTGIEELRKRNTKLTDGGQTVEPIEVLLGADVAGRLMTRRREVLPGGLLIIETYPGWTLMGKAPQNGTFDSNLAMMVTSLFIEDVQISDLWGLIYLAFKIQLKRRPRSRHIWTHRATSGRQSGSTKKADMKSVCLGRRTGACWVAVGILLSAAYKPLPKF
jgi:hypothetical protein